MTGRSSTADINKPKFVATPKDAITTDLAYQSIDLLWNELA